MEDKDGYPDICPYCQDTGVTTDMEFCDCPEGEKALREEANA